MTQFHIGDRVSTWWSEIISTLYSTSRGRIDRGRDLPDTLYTLRRLEIPAVRINPASNERAMQYEFVY